MAGIDVGPSTSASDGNNRPIETGGLDPQALRCASVHKFSLTMVSVYLTGGCPRIYRNNNGLSKKGKGRRHLSITTGISQTR